MPRVGLVLGAGGAVGGAFHAGVLAALADFGWDPRSAEIIVGTSAGSISGAALRAGLAAPDLAARAEGRPLSVEGTRLLADMPPYPVLQERLQGRASRRRAGRTGPAAPGRLLSAAARPWEIRMGTLAAALLPPGDIDMSNIAAGFDALFPQGWPERNLWIVAVRLDDGRRTVFGEQGAPPASVPEAVAASCAIPGVFTPVTIGGVRYVDGGAWSPTNLDLVSMLGLDLVVVSSPMSIAGRLSPSNPVRLDTAARRLFRGYLAREVAAARRRKTLVLAFQPTAEDVALMGMNAMDESRRPAVCVQARGSATARLGRPEVARAVELLAGARSIS